MFGSLLVAAHDQDGQLVLLGSVGTGFSDSARRSLHLELLALSTATPPVAGAVPSSIAVTAHWAAPSILARTAIRPRTRGHHHPRDQLIHPSTRRWQSPSERRRIGTRTRSTRHFSASGRPRIGSAR
ncbi:hypothetical protein ACQP06_28040 [Nocardia sp. CA-136227]|uniref:ATP dependent DNA ligase n=1 Tax=Nocardia sp. CA-136227 TaxID=3239979 RepID=UPI003D95D7FE